MRAFLSLNYPFERSHTSFYNYLVNEKSLFRKQNKFLETDDDLAALADCKESSWLDLALGKVLHWCVPRNVSISPLSERKLSDTLEELLHRPNTASPNRRRFHPLAQRGPRRLPDTNDPYDYHRCTACRSSIGAPQDTTRTAKPMHNFRHENFAATAAYCAVLVVFPSNVSTP